MIPIEIIEIVGSIATVLAVAGVLLNNAKRRSCFLVWTVSNSMFAAVHLSATPIVWSLPIRDAVFFALGVAGWIQWGRNGRTPNSQHGTPNIQVDGNGNGKAKP